MKWCYLPAQPLKCMDCLQEPLRQISMNCALQSREDLQCHAIWYHNMSLCCSLTCLRFSGKIHFYLNTPPKYTLKGRYCSSQKTMKTNKNQVQMGKIQEESLLFKVFLFSSRSKECLQAHSTQGNCIFEFTPSLKLIREFLELWLR